MKLVDVIKTANSNLLRNKGRSFLTILAIFIGSFTIIMTTGINTGVNGYIDKQLASAGGAGYLEIMPKGTSEALGGSGGLMGGSDTVQEYNPNKNAASLQYISPEDLARIRQISGVKTAKAFQMIQAEYITSDINNKKFVVKVQELPSDSINVDMATGRMVNLTAKQPEIALQEKFIAPLGLGSNADAVGKKVRVAVMNQVTKKITEIEMTVSGVMNPGVVNMGRSLVNESANSKLYAAMTDGLPAAYKNQAYFAMAQLNAEYSRSDAKISKVKDELKNMGFTAMTVEDEVGMVKTFFDAITIVLTIFGVIALIAASIGIINTLFMAVQERTREIGLMKAMGLGKGKIFMMFSFEAIALGFWGGAIGVALAYVAKTVANSLAQATFLKNLPGFTLVEFNPITLIVIVAIIMLIAFLAGTLPARRAAKKDPIEALRYE